MQELKHQYKINLNYFIWMDQKSDDWRYEKCQTLHFNLKNGVYKLIKASFNSMEGNYSKKFLNDKINLTIKRPKIETSKSLYYLDLINSARKDKESNKIIKNLISLYEMEKRHEKMDKEFI